MTEHERLIEVLNKQSYPSPLLCDKNCKYAHLPTCYPERVADHLLANKCHILPCDIGDTVYTNCRMQGWYFREKDKPYAAKIVFIGLNGVDNFMNVDLPLPVAPIMPSLPPFFSETEIFLRLSFLPRYENETLSNEI